MGQVAKRFPRREEPTRRRDYTPPRAQEDDRQPEHRPRREDPPRRDGRRDDREIINTIVGGGSSNSARKKHFRTVHQVSTISFRPRMSLITFTDEDFKGVDPSQDDIMVISVDIFKFTIMKTLVDHGSSVDILYSKTFR